jgi:uncharacterized protein YcfJ
VLAAAALAGCATAPQGYAHNYGHPALNAAMAPPAPSRSNDPARVAGGALLGGLAGAQVGSGSGQVAAAGAGAAIGAMAAQGGISQEATLGAVAGGLIGSRVGNGTGRVAASALGAGLGAWLAVPKD